MKVRAALILALALAVLLVTPLAGRAQPAAKQYRIGVLAIADPTDTPPPPPENWEGFLQGLREVGYVEGQNVAFELRSVGGRPERFSELAAEPLAAGAEPSVPVVGFLSPLSPCLHNTGLPAIPS